MDTTVGCFHVCFVHPDDFVWVSSAELVNAMYESAEGVTILARFEEVFDDSAVWARFG